jgi:hypothetical protein
MRQIIISVFFLISFSGYADEPEVLTVDRVVPNNLQLAFPNDMGEKPQVSDFQLVNYVAMSNDVGERWAVVTVRNSSSGGRSFENEHLMAVFADGVRKSPSEFKINFKGNETQTLTVSFGENKFPILSISTDAAI